MNKFLTLAATSLAALQMQVVAQETRPNIIYIMSDDHALQAISAYGSRLAKVLPTPNLDRIANEGKDIEYDSSPEIDAIMSQIERDW